MLRPRSTCRCPGARFGTTIWPLSPIEPAASPLNAKLPGAWSGLVCFSTMIVPRFVFVKTQRHGLACRERRSTLGFDSSEQTADVRSQPAGMSSETEYVPGSEVARVVRLAVREVEAVSS